MKKFFLSFVMALAILVPTVLTSCEKNDGGNGNNNLLEGNELGGSAGLDINTVVELDASVEYKLTGKVVIKDGGELRIPAGTVIKAEKNKEEVNYDGFEKYILVAQGGKIFINGTAQKPVTMTVKVAGTRWGGLIVNGRAPLSGGEISTAEINDDYAFGGNNADDNSGRITYLKLEYTGEKNSAEVEHNGLTLNGVGRGTVVENIYIPHGMDDGIEFFGGNVNVKNLLVVNSDDDMFDATQGWSGTLENAYGVWTAGFASGEKDPSGVEADGNYDGLTPSQTGQSKFTIRNMTIENNGVEMNNVIMIRRCATATIENALLKGSGTVKSSGFVVNVLDKGSSSDKANIATSVNITNKMTNSVADTNGGSEYPNITVGGNNTGCTADFSWSGYNF